MAVKTQQTKYEQWIENRKRFVSSKLASLIKYKGWTKDRTSKESGVHVQSIYQILRAQHFPSESMIRRLANAFGVPVSEFNPDQEQLFRKEIINSVLYGSGIRETSKEYGIPIPTVKTMLDDGPEMGDMVRAQVKKLLEENPMYGPSSVGRDLGIDGRYIAKFCKGMFAPKSERVPLPMRSGCDAFRFERLPEGNNSYRILLLLVNGVAECDISDQMGCSYQLVYHVRDEAIKAGFKFF
jgi:transcriptional regulator with XRE-family HTH domain